MSPLITVIEVFPGCSFDHFQHPVPDGPRLLAGRTRSGFAPFLAPGGREVKGCAPGRAPGGRIIGRVHGTDCDVSRRIGLDMEAQRMTRHVPECSNPDDAPRELRRTSQSTERARHRR